MKNVYIGNFLDFLEFSLFTALLPFIIRDVMGESDPHSREIFGYLILYLGFLTRPLGAYFLGKIGDIYGRKKLLLFSIFGMSFATFFFSILPQNLWSGIYIIALLRLFQGLFTGAEHAAATVYTFENGKNAGREIAMLTSSGIFGAATAQLLTLVCSQEGIIGWRACFAFIAILSVLVGYARLSNIPETYSLQKESPNTTHHHLSSYLGKVALGALMTGLANGLFYLITSYLNINSMILSNKIIKSAFIVNFISTSFLGIALLAWNYKSQKIRANPYTYILYALIGMGILLYPMFYATIEWGTGVLALAIQIAFVLITQLFTYATLHLIPNFFPESIRVQGTGFSVHLGNSLFGGVAPLISANLTQFMGTRYAPLIYFSTLILFLTIIVITIKSKAPSSLEYKAA